MRFAASTIADATARRDCRTGWDFNQHVPGLRAMASASSCRTECTAAVVVDRRLGRPSWQRGNILCYLRAHFDSHLRKIPSSAWMFTIVSRWRGFVIQNQLGLYHTVGVNISACFYTNMCKRRVRRFCNDFALHSQAVQSQRLETVYVHVWALQSCSSDTHTCRSSNRLQ